MGHRVMESRARLCDNNNNNALTLPRLFSNSKGCRNVLFSFASWNPASEKATVLRQHQEYTFSLGYLNLVFILWPHLIVK